jgi:DNA/RNA endonuclease G (NUC1)
LFGRENFILNQKISKIMFSWFFKKKDKVKELEARYAALLLEGRDIQRSGDLKAYAVKVEEIEKVLAELEAAKKEAAEKS